MSLLALQRASTINRKCKNGIAALQLITANHFLRWPEVEKVFLKAGLAAIHSQFMHGRPAGYFAVLAPTL